MDSNGAGFLRRLQFSAGYQAELLDRNRTRRKDNSEANCAFFNYMGLDAFRQTSKLEIGRNSHRYRENYAKRIRRRLDDEGLPAGAWGALYASEKRLKLANNVLSYSEALLLVWLSSESLVRGKPLFQLIVLGQDTPKCIEALSLRLQSKLITSQTFDRCRKGL